MPVQGWLHCILYVLFENGMGIVKLWAVIAGDCPTPILSLSSWASDADKLYGDLSTWWMLHGGFRECDL